MNPELQNHINNLAPFLAVGLLALGGYILSRFRRPEDPFMKGREEYIDSKDPGKLHPDDSLAHTLEEGGITHHDK